MFAATVTVSAVLSLMLLGSAAGKLRKVPAVMASMSSVGVPAPRVPLLAGVEVLGAAGLLVGLAWAPLGIAAAAGVVLYFVLAVGAHARVRDLRHAPPAAVIGLLALLALVLRSNSA